MPRKKQNPPSHKDPKLDGRTPAGRAALGKKKNGLPKGRTNNPRGPYKNRTFLYSEDDIVKALELSGGLVSVAAKNLGCAKDTIHERAAKSARIRKAMRANRSHLISASIGVVAKKVMCDEDEKVAMFVLRTLGKKLGFTEQQVLRVGGDPDSPPLKAGVAALELTPEDCPPELLLQLRQLYEAKARAAGLLPGPQPEAPTSPQSHSEGGEAPEASLPPENAT